MRTAVLDSHALIAFLFAEEGHEKVVILLEKTAESGRTALVTSPNWAEVRCYLENKVGAGQWDEIRTRLLGLPIEVIPIDQELAEIAGEIKARRGMPLALCFAAALAKQRKAELYTGDPAFAVAERELRIVWITDPVATRSASRHR